jgi:hypothetical protein
MLQERVNAVGHTMVVTRVGGRRAVDPELTSYRANVGRSRYFMLFEVLGKRN